MKAPYEIKRPCSTCDANNHPLHHSSRTVSTVRVAKYSSYVIPLFTPWHDSSRLPPPSLVDPLSNPLAIVSRWLCRRQLVSVSTHWSSYLLWSTQGTTYHRRYGPEFKGWPHSLPCASIAIHLRRATHRTNPATALHPGVLPMTTISGECLPNAYLGGQCCTHSSAPYLRVSDK